MNPEPIVITYIYLQQLYNAIILVIADKFCIHIHDRYALLFKVSQYNLQNQILSLYHSENISLSIDHGLDRTYLSLSLCQSGNSLTVVYKNSPLIEDKKNGVVLSFSLSSDSSAHHIICEFCDNEQSSAVLRQRR